jgi:SRSO17 transposase
VAFELAPQHWHNVTWREGTNAKLRSRFARVRVRAAHRDNLRRALREPQWLVIEWPKGDSEPHEVLAVHAERRHAARTHGDRQAQLRFRCRTIQHT